MTPAEPASDRKAAVELLPPWMRPVSSLAYSEFRMLMVSQFSSSLAYWMEIATMGWLVYLLTGSGLLLGVVTGARSLPLLFLGVVGGVFADRYDRRRLISLGQGVTVLVNAVMGLLVLTGTINVWHLLVGSLVTGTGIAFQNPARQSLMPNLLPRQHLLNAVAMNSAFLNLSRALGPAVAGVVLSTGGPAVGYAVQTLFYLAAAVAINFIRVAPAESSDRLDSMLANLMGGLRYAVANRVVLGLLAVALAPYLLAQPYVGLMPIFAEGVLGIGASGLGLLLAAPGVGALLGIGLLAAAGDLPRKGAWAIGMGVAFGLSTALFAVSPWLVTSLALLLVSGFTQTASNALIQTLLQTQTPDLYRGRVMSLYLLDRGFVPLGSALMGGAADLIGAPAAVALLTLLSAVLSLATALRLPEIRRI